MAEVILGQKELVDIRAKQEEELKAKQKAQVEASKLLGKVYRCRMKGEKTRLLA